MEPSLVGTCPLCGLPILAGAPHGPGLCPAPINLGAPLEPGTKVAPPPPRAPEVV